jgi:histidine triad (HIT) family protein
MEDSIFTKIIKGEIPCHKVYEDDKTLAFLDIHPSQPGHTLVVPKKQIEFIWDLQADDYQALMSSVQKIGRQLRAVLQIPYVGIKVVGEEVPHAHVHIVPFTTVAQYVHLPDTSVEPDHQALAAMAEKLKL